MTSDPPSICSSIDGFCAADGPNLVASNGVVHDSGGCGGANRRSPTGGAANRMARQTDRLSTSDPCTGPERVSTVGPGTPDSLERLGRARAYDAPLPLPLRGR